MSQNDIFSKSRLMEKFILAGVCLLTVAFLLGCIVGIPCAHHSRGAYMPAAIRYLVKIDDNIWPDWVYAAGYDTPQERSIHFAGYWTFEPEDTPLSGFVWIYHANDHTYEDVNYTIIEIIRTTS